MKNDNATGNSTTKTNYITVLHNPLPVAGFTMNTSSGDVPLTVAFTNTSTGNNIYSIQWDFGDGNTSTSQNPTHTYTSVGTYMVTLTVTNDGGPSSIQNTVTVLNNALPVALFVGSPRTGNTPLIVALWISRPVVTSMHGNGTSAMAQATAPRRTRLTLIRCKEPIQ